MAKITAVPKLGINIQFQVDESEARALEALSGYGDDAFIKNFYEFLGRYYMEPHEQGLRSFLKSIREQVSSPLSRMDEARKFLNDGGKVNVL